jgi:hypothetical protein
MRKEEELILEYLSAHKKKIRLDEYAKHLLEISDDELEYCEYVISEITLLLRKNGISLEHLDAQTSKIVNVEKMANYSTGFDLILIRKEVPEKFIICEFIHEHAHRNFYTKKWNKSKYKPDKTGLLKIDELEEYTCKIISYEYAKEKGFGDEYAKVIGLFNYKTLP